MFLPNQFRKTKKTTAGVVLYTFIVTLVLNQPVMANSEEFDAGKQMGQSSLSVIKNTTQSGASLPSFGSTSSTDLGTNYPGDGRDSPSAITDLMSAGENVKNEACAEGDQACSARSFVSDKYGASQINPYKGVAQDMRSGANQLNPEDVLGMNNLPTEGPSETCVETTTTLPPSTEEKVCLDATLQQTTLISKLPITTGYDYSSPICVDPEYTLSADKSTCEKTGYSCPMGGYYDGVQCKKDQNYISVGGTIFGACSTCPDGYVEDPTGQADCVNYYPATQHYDEVSAGCFGGPTYSAGQLVEDPRTSNGTYTCQSETYSCPAGMAMNGSICEDVNRMQYEADPNCVNLGYIPESETEGYLCVTQELRECDTMPDTCTETASECIYVDDVPNSPTYGQCIATERTFECPVNGKEVTETQCSYQPLCMGGNCFEQEEKCPAIPGITPTQTTSNTCQIMTKEDIESCAVNYQYSAPDEDGERHIIGATPVAGCEFLAQDNCLLQEVTIKTDADGEAYWPNQAYFSCLGDTLDLCQQEGYDSNDQCTLTDSQIMQRSIADDTVPIVESKTYQCTETMTVPTDECTDDFAKMAVAMEASRQGGEYFDPDNMRIFKGEFHRCDRRAASWGGANFGSKSCCNISAPDPQSNRDIMQEAKMSVAMDAATSLLSYTSDTGSNYVYDWMMQSETFADVSGKLSAMATKISDSMDSLVGATNTATEAATLTDVSYGVSYAGVGISYGASTGFGTSSYLIGSNTYMTFNPYMFAITVAVQLYAAYQAAIACDEKDYKTATLKKGKLCYSYGTWCERENCGLFGCTCEKYRTGHCCYNSLLARLINEQGREQLGLPMDRCDGFTVEQIQQLDWNQIDLSQFIAEMLDKAQEGIPTTSEIQALTNKLSTNVNAATTGTQPIDQSYNGNQRPHH